jgi:hypothetical protein
MRTGPITNNPSLDTIHSISIQSIKINWKEVITLSKSLRGIEDEGYKDGMNHEYEPPHNSIFQGYSKEEVEEVKAYNKGHEEAKKDRD